jgi:HAD superfamily hydrolase (TIGR01509 family)
MISNMTRDTLSFLETRFTWLELFDGLCFSCDLGISKPDKRIYETCLRELDISPEECLFVDDSAKNVKGALESGLHAIQYKTFAEFVQELEVKFRLER